MQRMPKKTYVSMVEKRAKSPAETSDEALDVDNDTPRQMKLGVF